MKRKNQKVRKESRFLGNAIRDGNRSRQSLGLWRRAYGTNEKDMVETWWISDDIMVDGKSRWSLISSKKGKGEDRKVGRAPESIRTRARTCGANENGATCAQGSDCWTGGVGDTKDSLGTNRKKEKVGQSSEMVLVVIDVQISSARNEAKKSDGGGDRDRCKSPTN